MGTNINFDVPDSFLAPQPKELFSDVNNLESGVKKLLALAVSSQDKLIIFLNAAAEKFKDSINIKIINPGIKSEESALRKAKDGYGVPNRLLMLTDPYRATIITELLDDVYKLNKWIEENAKKYGFTIRWTRDYFKKPWSGGYREINIRLSDDTNQDLVGELQIHLCSVKKFSLLAGHKSHEIQRTLPEDNISKNKIKKALNQVTYYGYDLSEKSKNIGCLQNINSIQSHMPKGGTRRRKNLRKRKQKSRRQNKK